ncbi:NAD(P)/FAD-dependent oxidoreductase [Brachybacterium sp. AOP25-B2-12]|uniref:NAD(P)/FAD-dependent oxidoreductase n=1 Tax=Brachybacterium sp. AOP25-B2-12 TaxID=3457710 RepID=UPI004034EADA
MVRDPLFSRPSSEPVDAGRPQTWTSPAPRRRRTVPAKDGASWPHVVIVGGGFAGANAVLGLRDTRVRITLIDRNLYKTFQPLLYQVATAGLNPGDVTMFLRGLSLKVPNMRYRQGEVIGVDPEHRRVSVEGANGHPWELDYDYLVLAGGATTNFFGTPGAEQYAMPMYTRSQALKIRDGVFAQLERTSREGEHDKLCVSIVGGGPTGVEIAGALADFRRQELDILYPEMDPGTLRIRLIQRGGELIKDFAPQYREYAVRELEARGVELCLGHGVAEVGYDFVRLDDDTVLESDITVWAAGVAPAEYLSAWGLPQVKGGRLQVDPDLQVTGVPRVFAAGDIAAQPEPLPQLAQPAIQSGRHVARMIDADVTNRPERRRPFEYMDLGTMATIGRRAAIAVIPHAPGLTGTAGWFAWLGVHVAKLIGHRNRRAVTMNLLTLYSGTRSTHQPNPVVGDVDSVRAEADFEDARDLRRFGPDHRG